MSKNQVGSSILWGALIGISMDVSIDTSLVTRLTNTSVGYVPRVYTGQTSTNISQYIDCDIVGRLLAEAYQSTTGQLPVVYWSTVGPVSVDSQEIVNC